MNNLKLLGQGLLRVLRPTSVQVLAALFVSVVGLLITQSHALFSRLGISDQAIALTQQHVTGLFSVILQSSLIGNIALVTFWAAIGLVAYLLCWSGYNALIAARNEVTIETQYTNKGHWQGIMETMALKAVAALLLVVYLTVFQYGLALWLALDTGLFTDLSTLHIVWAVAATVGFAMQLYGLLILVQLTITPWYRPGAFTDQPK